jgi:hypothetical protein
MALFALSAYFLPYLYLPGTMPLSPGRRMIDITGGGR